MQQLLLLLYSSMKHAVFFPNSVLIFHRFCFFYFNLLEISFFPFNLFEFCGFSPIFLNGNFIIRECAHTVFFLVFPHGLHYIDRICKAEYHLMHRSPRAKKKRSIPRFHPQFHDSRNHRALLLDDVFLH